MNILGIESSCDETAAAVVKDGREVLSNVVASQIDLHKKFGGVVPEVAARAHLDAIDPVVKEALSNAQLSVDEIDMVAVSQGPGLLGSLLIGVSYARGFGLAYNKPVVPVNHVHAHIYGALLGVETSEELFPCLALVVSGGHTNLYLMNSVTEFKLLGFTLDDACGECFDKVAKKLELGYPGGPVIERLAKDGDRSVVEMPRMVKNDYLLRFSYSGLKTHVMYKLRDQSSEWLEAHKADLCAAFQEEALGQIVRKLKAALKQHHSIKSVVVAGGVSANKRFRELTEELGIPAYFPPLAFCSDNGAMIAACGYHFRDQPVSSDWDAYSRYPYADG